MPVESDADRAVFINTDEHGSVVTYTTRSGVRSTFSAIFDNLHEAFAATDEVEIGGQQPRLTMRTSDVPANSAEGDQVKVAGATYKRAGALEPDGTGMTVMPLVKVR